LAAAICLAQAKVCLQQGQYSPAAAAAAADDDSKGRHPLSKGTHLLVLILLLVSLLCIALLLLVLIGLLVGIRLLLVVG
jgi:hypothetical protein